MGSSSSKRIVFVLASALGAIALLAGWLVSRRRSEPRASATPAESQTEAETPAPDPPPRWRPEPPPAPKREEPVADDGVGFMPLQEGDRAPPGMLHPHRITEQHRRNFAEIRIATAIDDAMDAQDVPAMKRLLEQYSRDFPEDLGELQGGYAVVIECLERPGPESRAAAERWIDHHNGSTIKRAVLRHCIEPRQP